MPGTDATIAKVRDSTCAIMRITRVVQQEETNPPIETYNLAFVGTAWCVNADRFLITAHHVLNDGKPRHTEDRFYAFTAPANGLRVHSFPVTGFHL